MRLCRTRLCVLCRSAIVPPLLFAKFGRFTPNRLALIGQKVALIGHGHFRKSLIMNKSSWKYGSFPKICKQLTISLTLVFWILIFNFPPCRFQRKAINETAAGKPTFFSSYPHSPTTNRIVARAASKYTQFFAYMHLNIALITYKQTYFLQNITLTTSILPFSLHKHRADPPANNSGSAQDSY